MLDVVSSNRPPRFVSAPRTLAIAGHTYTDTVVVTDADAGDTPTLTLEAGPVGLSLSGTALSWTPSLAQLGTHAVRLRATDREGVSVTQVFALDVDETNHRPTMTSTAPRTATQDALYTYQAVVHDANARDGTSFTLLTAPSGMTVGAGGLVRWTPSRTQVGNASVRLRAQDAAGLAVEQAWTIAVANVNDPPEFTSSAVTVATEHAAYTYTAVATDPDSGDTAHYVLEAGPAGMTVAGATGVVSWTPTSRQVASHPVRIRALDDHGASVAQSYTVTVSNVNDPPSWVSTPVTTVLAGARYLYRPHASDPDTGDTVTYAVTSGPAGLHYDAARSLVTWEAPASGAATVVLSASDGHGGTSAQTDALQVISDEEGPHASVTVSPLTIAPGGMATVALQWTDNATVTVVSLTMDGLAVALDGEGRATVTSTIPGVHVLVAHVEDGAGNATDVEARLGVHDPSDTTPPVVVLTSPVQDEVVLMQRSVTGTVAEAHLVEWRLVLEAVDGEESRALGRGVGTVSGVLGLVDGTLLENGWWNLILEATDVNGVTSRDQVTIEVQGEAKVGVVRLAFIDMQVPAVGIPITITRTYDSRVKSQRDFGIGWDLEINAGKIEHNRHPGIGWSLHEDFPPPSFPCAVVDELSQHYTTIHLGDREWYTFRPVLNNVASAGSSCFADVGYEFVDGYVPGATLHVLPSTTVFQLTGADELIDEITLMPWRPEQVLLETLDGRRITLSAAAGITSIEDRNGNHLTIGEDGIVHSSGRAIEFTRDGEGRISTIEDPMGNTVVYTYDGEGDLAAVENQLEETTSFEYAHEIPHHLTRINIWAASAWNPALGSEEM